MRQPVSSSSGSGRAAQGGATPRDRGRRQLSLMHVFRSCAENRTSRQSQFQTATGAGEERTATPTMRLAREGVSPEDLRRHLGIDLAVLMNTVRLDAAIDLADAPQVRRSVLNHGFLDLTAIDRNRRSELLVAEQIRQTLIEREPRIDPQSLHVAMGEQDQTRTDKLVFRIEAEIIAYPANVPVGFTAEIDVGAGKMRMRGLQGGA